MKNWQEDILNLINGGHDANECFAELAEGARALGFEYCAYGLRVSYPLFNRQATLLNNYPETWQNMYRERDYVLQDPTVRHGQSSTQAMVWSYEMFANSPELWNEAQSFGLRVGWAKSYIERNGIFGILTLARSAELLTEAELQHKSSQMNWLAQAAHLNMSRHIMPTLTNGPNSPITPREAEALKWIGDGKTSAEIGLILSISEHTVNFHIKNAITKLNVTNRTAAVVMAVVMGLL